MTPVSSEQIRLIEVIKTFERFTDRARRTVTLAQEEARLMQSLSIGTDHLLLGGIHEGEGVFAKVLSDLVEEKYRDHLLEWAREAAQKRQGSTQKRQGTQGVQPVSAQLKQVFEFSLREALEIGHNYIGTEHLLLGLLRGPNLNTAQEILRDDLGFDLGAIRQKTIETLAGYNSVAKATLRPEHKVGWEHFSPQMVECTVCGGLAMDRESSRARHENWHASLLS